MSEAIKQDKTGKDGGNDGAKKQYVKPAFEHEQVFETMAASPVCPLGGCTHP